MAEFKPYVPHDSKEPEFTLKAVVATSALGMGYDKPDLAFCIHVGSPASPVARLVSRRRDSLPHRRQSARPAAPRSVWAWPRSTTPRAPEGMRDAVWISGQWLWDGRRWESPTLNLPTLCQR